MKTKFHHNMTNLHSIALLVLISFLAITESRGQCTGAAVTIENSSSTSSIPTVISPVGLSPGNNICGNTEYLLSTTPDSVMIQWPANVKIDGVLGPASTTDSLTTASVEFLGTGPYLLTIDGCDYNFYILDNPTASLATVPAFSCNGIGYGDDFEVEGNCLANCGGTPTFSWDFIVDTTGLISSSANNSTLTIPNNSLTLGLSYNVLLTVGNGLQDTTGAGCIDTAMTSFVSKEKPNLSNLTFIGTPSNKICISEDFDSQIRCINCLSTSTLTWSHLLTSGPSPPSTYTTFGGGSSPIAGASFNYFTIDPEVGTYLPGVSTPELYPGTYSIQALVEMDGCIASKTKNLTINDRPAVNIYWQATDPANTQVQSGANYYEDNAPICAGTNITLKAAPCSATAGTSMDINRWLYQSQTNYSGNTFHPSTGIIASAPNQNPLNSEYNCPCENNSGSTDCNTGAYYQLYDWSIISGAPAATLTTSTIRDSVNSSPNISGASVTVTYKLEVTGRNGCTNSDEIILDVNRAPISFNYPSDTNSTGSLNSTATITVCKTDSIVEISGHCGSVPGPSGIPDCIQNGSTFYTWSEVVPHNPTININTTPGSNQSYIQTEDFTGISSTGTQRFQLDIVDQFGCEGRGTIKLEVVDLDASFLVPDPVCSDGSSLLFIQNANHSSSLYYDIYADSNHTIPIRLDAAHDDGLPTNQGIEIDVSTLTPGDGDCGDHGTTFRYHIVVKDQLGPSPSCFDEVFIDFDLWPEIIIDDVRPNFSPIIFCTDQEVRFSTKLYTHCYRNLEYTWSVGPAMTGIIPYLDSKGLNGSSDSWQIESNNTIEVINGSLSVIMTDKGGVCSVSQSWTDINILNCEVTPLFWKEKINNTLILPQKSPFKTYLCKDETLKLELRFKNTSTALSPIYSWSNGETTSSISISPAVLTLGENIYCVEVNTDGGASIDPAATDYFVFCDTSILSKAPFIFYPQDTSTCLDKAILGLASCPSCYNIEYLWENTGATNGNFYTNGAALDSFIFLPNVLPGNSDFLNLRMRHGEGCVDSLESIITINAPPEPYLRDQQGDIISGPIYLCAGETQEIYIEPTSCGSPGCSFFSWNTTATTDSILVSAQGGYYALVHDGNGCLGASDVVVFVEADEGLNSPIIANPSQICSGGDVVLEIVPSVGCSYEWFNVLNPTIPLGSNVTYTTNSIDDYFAEVTNIAGCTYSTSQVSLTTATLSAPTVFGTTDSLCANHSSNLTTTPILGGSYQWYLNGVIISAATDTLYIATETGGYSVAVTYPNGCIEESLPFVITGTSINPPIYYTDTIICLGSNANLSTDLNPGWTYQWYDDGIAIIGATSVAYAATTPGAHYVEVTTDFGCVALAAPIEITTSSLGISAASTTTADICIGDTGVVVVSLCSNCSYQWFDATTGFAISSNSPTEYRFDEITVGGDYYAIVTDPSGVCAVSSDTVTINLNTVLIPAITSSSPLVCDGRDALLETPSCLGCSYTWYVDSLPVLGGLNDTTHLVNNILDDGDYWVEVTYPNSCKASSAVIPITDSSYLVDLTSVDEVICNGVAENLNVLSHSLAIGTSFFTLYLDNTPVTGYTSVPVAGSVATFPGDSAGVYRVLSVNPLGCRSWSNTILLETIDLSPVLTSHATSNPSSVAASAICTDSGRVYLEVTPCNNCSYEWLVSGNPVSADSTVVVLSEDFSTNFLASGWIRRSSGDPLADWVWGDVNTHSSTGFLLPTTNSSYFAASNDDTCVCDMSEDRLVSPAIDLSLVGPLANVDEAWMSFDAFFLTGNSSGTVEVSFTGSGGPWVSTIYTMSGSPNWQLNETVDLTPYLGTTIWLAFRHNDNNIGEGFAVDNIEVIAVEKYHGTSNIHLSHQGVEGTGIYIVNVTQNGCTAASNPVTVVDLIGTINTDIVPEDSVSICDGQVINLEHNDAILSPGNYNTVAYRWLRTPNAATPGNPIGGANSQLYITNTPGYYSLEMTTIDGCVDTSAVLTVIEVNPPDSFFLAFDSSSVQGIGTPLASNGTAIGLNNWVYPDSVRIDSLTEDDFGYFTSAPYNGALSANAGLSEAGDSTFTPHHTLIGNHLITYHLNTRGCVFEAQDVLEVLPEPSIVVTNSNPVSIPYEACIGDTLTVTTTYLQFPVYLLEALDEYGIYINMTLTNPPYSVVDTNFFGVDTFYSTTISFVVPVGVYASNLNLIETIGGSSVLSRFVLIHNTDLSFSGLPISMLCSNGSPIKLSGNPSGGSFHVQDTSAPYNIVGPAIVGDSLYPTSLDTSNYTGDNQWIDVIYSYRETLTDGTFCPINTDTQSIEVKDVRLTAVSFNHIAISQEQELLSNLVNRVSPYEARANPTPPTWYTTSYSGSFTTPQGAPLYFHPKNAGIGRHALTYQIQAGDCVNWIEDSITVIAAPLPFPIPDTICRNMGFFVFDRDTATYPYYLPGQLLVSPGVLYIDSFNLITIRSVNSTQIDQALDTLHSVPVNKFQYDPSLLPGGVQQDFLVIEYWFERNEYNSGTDFDSISYVIGSVYHPIFIEDPITTTIDRNVTDSFYCEESSLHQLIGSSSNTSNGGVFMLFGGTGQYATGDTLHNSIINPYDVNTSEGATTTYKLKYFVDQVACRSVDSMNIVISKGLNPSFATTSGRDEFCDTDLDELITHNILPPDTAIWKIGGVPQANYVFSPALLLPGTYVVEIQAIDTFNCAQSATKIFTIHPMDTPSWTLGLNTAYCYTDEPVDFEVGPSPTCPTFGPSIQNPIIDSFELGLTWSTINTSGSAWTLTGLLPQGNNGNAAFIDANIAVTNSTLQDSVYLLAGHTYRLTYMVRAGSLDPLCTGSCNAILGITLGNTSVGLSSLDYQPNINNSNTYVRYTVNHYHDPSNFTTGNYALSLHCTTPALGRSLRLDNVRLRDITIGNCSLAGIGYVNGAGIHNIIDSLYQFNPLAVDPNTTTKVTYIYTNINGCTDSIEQFITVGDIPTVSFSSMDSAYCDNASSIMLTGLPLGGEFTSSLGINVNLMDTPSAPANTAWYPVNYQLNAAGTDTISYTIDSNGCSATIIDTVVIHNITDKMEIYPPPLDPTGLGYGLCVNAIARLIIVTPVLPSSNQIDNGIFYGPGVRNGHLGHGFAMFHPDSAAIDMGHTGDVTIIYIYPTGYGCMDTVSFSTTVHPTPDLSFVNLPDSLCLNTDPIEIRVANSDVTTGSYTILGVPDVDLNAPALPNFFDILDTLHPSIAIGLNQVNVTASFTADPSLGGCQSTIYKTIRIDTFPITYFQGMQASYCQNEDSSLVLAFPPYQVGSGYLSVDNIPFDSSFYWVHPNNLVFGQHPVYYTYTDTRGCTGEVFDTFDVAPSPIISFSPIFSTVHCRDTLKYDLIQHVISPLGGYFTDNLALTSIVNDSLDLNSAAGSRVLTYHYADPGTACYDEKSIIVELFSSPEIDFEALGGCAMDSLTFMGTANNLIDNIDSITSIDWNFNSHSAPLTPSPLGSNQILIPNFKHLYNSSGIKLVTLYVQNRGNCIDSITKTVIVSPHIDLQNYNYIDSFNVAIEDWYTDQPLSVSPNPIWEHSLNLQGNKINDPGNGAWVTLNNSLYDQGQSAWVYSPCFDFTHSKRPMIVFDLWRDLLQDIDGVVLEVYDSLNNTWNLVGDYDQGINWYQSTFVLSRPGNQGNATFPRGWTNRSNGFEKARLKLDQFKGKNNVRFRIAFASSDQTVITDYEGAAFDNVWIGERTRNVLVEHFSNTHYVSPFSQPSEVIDASVYNKLFNSAYGQDAFLIQYQTELSSPLDFVNLQNDIGPAVRTYFYGISDDNQLMIDGTAIGTGISFDLNPSDLDFDMLQFPDFEVTISTPTISNDILTVASTVTALVNKPQTEYAVHTVVIQDSFTIDPNGNGFNMLSISRKMLPNPAGQDYIRSWVTGDFVTDNLSWDFSNELGEASFDENQLEVMVFIQNMETKEIYQVQTTQDLNKYTGSGKLEDEPAAEVTNLTVYPNPSSDLFNIEFDKALIGSYNWKLIDVTGRILQTGTTQSGIQKFIIDAERLTNGTYFFVINNETVYAQRKLVVIK